MTVSRDDHMDTLLAQALGWIDPHTRAVTPAIHPATTYVRDHDGSNAKRYSYSRDDNPTYTQLEAVLTALEGGADAMVLAAGLSAASLPFLTLAPGDHVVLQDVVYWGLRKWINGFAARHGIAVDNFSTAEPTSLAAALRPGQTKLVWIETPANPTWEVVDIAAAADAAHDAGAKLVVDSTAATPVLTRPLDLGADLIMHAATKYLNGHSDVLAGALVVKEADSEWWREMRQTRQSLGLVLGPQEAWLLLRGMRTLSLRMRQVSANALALATHLQNAPAVMAVIYPGLPDHPGHAIAARQMHGGFGGLLSIRVAGGFTAASEVARNTRLFKEATSFGGVESLIEHRAPIEGPGTKVPEDLLRLAVGIEHIDDLIADLDQALARLT